MAHRVAGCNPGGTRFEVRWCCLWFWFIRQKIVGKLLYVISKYSVMIVETRQINYGKISLISKYSVFIVGTRRINSIFMLTKFSFPLTSESVTPGQAGGVFRQLFLQWTACTIKWNHRNLCITSLLFSCNQYTTVQARYCRNWTAFYVQYTRQN